MPFVKLLIEIEGDANSPANRKLLPAFAKQFGVTAHPQRFWVPGKDWARKISALWDATLQPDGIPAEITAIIGMNRAMTETEWQEYLKGAGIIAELMYSVIASDWGDEIEVVDKYGYQVQDGFPHTVQTEKEAELWEVPA